MGTEFDGDHLSRGINLMGIVCPGGQEVGDRKSGDQMGSGPNASQPGLGMKPHMLLVEIIIFSLYHTCHR